MRDNKNEREVWLNMIPGLWELHHAMLLTSSQLTTFNSELE